MSLRAFSYGGGVQSTAALVLAAQGRIDFPVFLFANVGEDSEHPATTEYVRDVALPYAEAHGVGLHILQKTLRDGTPETILSRLANGRVAIPVRGANGAPGRRQCTADFKIGVIRKWLKANGATEDSPAVIGMGISTDEIQRATSKRTSTCEVVTYPLIDLRLDRAACAEVIKQAGIPVPRKSACYFCPFHTIGAWRELRRDEPDLWSKAVELERSLNERGKEPVYFNSRAVPLTQLPEADAPLFDGDGVETCDTGSCFT